MADIDSKRSRPAAAGQGAGLDAAGEAAPSTAREATLTGSGRRYSADLQVDFAARASDDAAAAPAAPAPPLRVIDSGEYVIEAEAGRGGVGVVYRARDRRLGRVVAVKELQHDDPTARLRFEREMRITARLQHPGVVPVHEAGCWPTGAPFYAMKLVEGSSLKTRIGEAPTLAARLVLLPSLVAVAETMAYAHAHRVTHRDLKPANVILGAYGETVVIDWGLAKELDEPELAVDAHADTLQLAPESLDPGTRIGTIVGTPAYMPPEQARGEAVDPRADVYALGAMLYHLLTGAPPFTGASSADVLGQVLAGPPRPIAALAPEVPHELVAIADKAMARDPARRYGSAGELAQELRRFQTGQLVDSYRYSRRELLGRWLRRHRGVALTAAAALLLLVAVGTGALVRVIQESARADRERDQAIRQRELAETAERSARRTAGEVILAHAASDVVRDPTMSLAWLKRLVPADTDPPRVRAIALAALSRPIATQVWKSWTGSLEQLVFSPDGTTLLVAAVGEAVILLDAGGGTERQRWPIDTEPSFLSASSDRRRVALLETPYKVAVVDLEAGRLSHPAGCAGLVAKVALSPDGRQLACLRPGAALAIVDLDGGRVVAWPASAAWPATTQLAWSADGRRLFAATGTEPAVLVFEPAGARQRRLPVPGARGGVGQVLAASPTRIFVATADGRAALVEHESGAVHWLTGPGEPSIEAGASPQAGVLAYRRAGEPARVVEVASGREQALPAACHGHGAPVVSPSGRYVAVSCADDQFLLWDQASSQAWTLAGHGGLGTAAFSPGEDRVATAGSDRAVRVWRVPAAAPLLARHAGASFHVVPAGPWVVTDGLLGSLAITDPATRRTRLWPIGHDMVYALAAGDGGRRVAAGSWDGQIVLWSSAAPDDPPRPLGPVGDPIWALAFDDGGRLLGDARTNGATLWPLDGGAAIELRGHTGEVRAIQLGRLAGERVALTGGEDGTVRLWALDGTPRRVWRGHTRTVQQVRFAGDTVVSGSADGTVRLWRPDRDDGTVLVREPTPLRALAVSPSRRYVAAASDDGTVAVHDRERGETVTLAAARGAVRTLEFDADERTLLSGSTSGTLWRWTWQSGEVCVLLQSGGLNGAAVVLDGTAVVTAGVSGEVRLATSTPTVCLSADPDTWNASLAAITRAETRPAGAEGARGKE